MFDIKEQEIREKKIEDKRGHETGSVVLTNVDTWSRAKWRTKGWSNQ